LIRSALARNNGQANTPPSIPQRVLTTQDLDDEGQAQCNICIEPLVVGDLVCCLYCNHFYHRECIETWFANNHSYSCPDCRAVYVPRD
jgi:predicted sulfurtransferase